jgi:hypothetical protein
MHFSPFYATNTAPSNEHSPKSGPFDEDSSWRALKHAAIGRFRRSKFKTVLPGRRGERLRDLKNALGRARDKVEKAMHDDVGIDLFRGWCAEGNISWAVFRDHGSSVLTRFEEVTASLAALETAASRAARDHRTKAGPPRETGILPPGDISALAQVYQRSTGQTPIMGAGHQFVEEFLTAVGRGDDTSKDYVFEALKSARKHARKDGARATRTPGCNAE